VLVADDLDVLEALSLLVDVAVCDEEEPTVHPFVREPAFGPSGHPPRADEAIEEPESGRALTAAIHHDASLRYSNLNRVAFSVKLVHARTRRGRRKDTPLMYILGSIRPYWGYLANEASESRWAFSASGFSISTAPPR
jgi:hypothetical protein